MTTSTDRIRHALALGAVVTLTGIAVSAATASVGRPPDVRDASTAAKLVAPDAIERYAAAHPYGIGLVTAATPVGRPPDVQDAAGVASGQGHRSTPITASLQSSASAVRAGTAGGFDWSDYGVGIGTGIGLVLLLAGGVAGFRRRQESVQTA